MLFSPYVRRYSDLRNVDAVVKGSLLDYAKNVNTFENVNTGDPTTDIPGSARYCIAHIMCRANSWFISVEGRDNRLYMNYNNGTDWTGWNSTALKSDLFTYEQKFENKDLNTIISPGCYGVGGKPSVSGVTNYPEDTTGMLVVFYNTGVTVQHYYTYLGSMYLRSKLVNYNDWSSWEKITK